MTPTQEQLEAAQKLWDRIPPIVVDARPIIAAFLAERDRSSLSTIRAQEEEIARLQKRISQPMQEVVPEKIGRRMEELSRELGYTEESLKRVTKEWSLADNRAAVWKDRAEQAESFLAAERAKVLQRDIELGHAEDIRRDLIGAKGRAEAAEAKVAALEKERAEVRRDIIRHMEAEYERGKLESQSLREGLDLGRAQAQLENMAKACLILTARGRARILAEFKRLNAAPSSPSEYRTEVAPSGIADLPACSPSASESAPSESAWKQEKKPCGCVTCICEDEIQCQGCGAKNCGGHAPDSAAGRKGK